MRHRTKSLFRTTRLLFALSVALGGLACNALIGAELGELRDDVDGLPDAEVSGPEIDGGAGVDGGLAVDAADGSPNDVKDASPDQDAALPAPTISFTSTPPDPSPATSFTFGYTITGATGDALCKLDAPGGPGTFMTCNNSATVVATPAVGTYTFTVRASNAVNATTDATYTWNKCTIPSPPGAFVYAGAITTYTIPTTCTPELVRIEVWGAEGGAGASPSLSKENPGGKGARMRGDFKGLAGVKLQILVGQKGESRVLPQGFNGGGGGGSFVWSASDNKLLIAAGGGGGGGGVNNTTTPAHQGVDGQVTLDGTHGNGMTTGAGTNGGGGVSVTTSSNNVWSGGGAGWLSNGANGFSASCGTAGGGKHPLDGGYGGLHGTNPNDTLGNGGFGGGGGAQGNCVSGGGGGGGGYSGGGGGSSNATYGYMGGGGGGSYNLGSSQSNSAGARTGNGAVSISW